MTRPIKPQPVATRQFPRAFVEPAGAGQPFIMRDGAGRIAFAENGWQWDFATGQTWAMSFVGGQATPVARDKLPGTVNSIYGTDPAGWQYGLATYGTLVYTGIWPGVDLAVKAAPARLTGRYTLAPGVDAGRLVWQHNGAVYVDKDTGRAQIALADGQMATLEPPRAWHLNGNERVPIAVVYRVVGPGRVALALGNYDLHQPLFVESPFLAPTDGITQDIVYAIAVTPNGEMVVAGETGSADFPVANAWQGSNAGNADAFVSKISADGQTLLFSTYLGGISDDVAYSLDLDTVGNIYVGGQTRSVNFPMVNALQSTRPGSEAAFIATLSPDGQALQFSTYLGGDQAYPPYGAKSQLAELVVDTAGGVYAVGTTTTPDFPVVNPLPYQADGSYKVFVTHLAPGGQQILFSTMLGAAGSRNEGADIAQDAAGRAYFLARSWDGGLPVVNPIQGSHKGAYDVYLARLAADHSDLEYATYLGGESWDVGTALAVDTGSNAYFTGWTASEEFPIVNAFQEQKLGNSDAFLSKMNAAGTDLVFSTYLGGSLDNNGYLADTSASTLAVDPSGRAAIAGRTDSIDFPLANPWQNSLNGPYFDAFITMFTPAGDNLVFSTYLGGTETAETAYWFPDMVRSLDVGGPQDHLFVGGSTTATDFPLVQPLYTYQGFVDGFVSRFDPIAGTLEYSTYLGGSAYPEPTDVNLSRVEGQAGVNRLLLWGGLLLLVGLIYIAIHRLKYPAGQW